MGTYSLAVNITRSTAGDTADSYENNNTQSTAYTLSASFSDNAASIVTTGTNFHTSSDVDYYKIVLPAGYNYTLTPRLDDKQSNSVTYTVNAKFSYARNTDSWSTAGDSHNAFTLTDGGTIYFKVEPYTSGDMGTYSLAVNITRSTAADSYENNNTQSTAYTLSASFSDNAASVATAGANIHTSSDEDYYKIVLPAGYNYTVTPRLDDNDNSNYTLDAKFSYLRNTGTWSAANDRHSAFTVTDGGTIYFKVEPYTSGQMGTYSLAVNITRSTAGGTADSYESNNTQSTAATLSASFSDNAASVATTGTNFHTSSDVDYYKIVLPAGYNYTVTPRLDDRNNSSHTVDAKFSYARNTDSWSTAGDSHSAITLTDGGTIYFKVEPYYSGDMGAYSLAVNITRSTAGGTAVAVTGVSLNKTSLTLTAGGSETLTATVSPSNATNKNVTWSSNNTNVATVDANGNVTAKTTGTATITVKTEDGDKTATCRVTVSSGTSSPCQNPIASGTCGSNLTWTLCPDGTLTISGSGAMTNYEWSVPWGNYKDRITTIVVQSGVTSIGERAFFNCTALTSVSLPNSVTSIEYGAFWGCGSLSSITLPSSLTNIGQQAFDYCSSLTSITIPASVTTIGNAAFTYCTGLRSITNLATTPQNIENNNVFLYVTIRNISLIVPSASLSKYQTAPVWRDFFDIKGYTATEAIERNQPEVYPNPVENELFIQSDKPVEKVEIFTASGHLVVSTPLTTINVSHLPKGIYIVRVLAGNQSMVKKIIKK
jgi:uncharacterized protein YjdB